MFHLGGRGSKRLHTVLVEARYDGQSRQEAKIGGLSFTMVVGMQVLVEAKFDGQSRRQEAKIGRLRFTMEAGGKSILIKIREIISLSNCLILSMLNNLMLHSKL